MQEVYEIVDADVKRFISKAIHGAGEEEDSTPKLDRTSAYGDQGPTVHPLMPEAGRRAPTGWRYT